MAGAPRGPDTRHQGSHRGSYVAARFHPQRPGSTPLPKPSEEFPALPSAPRATAGSRQVPDLDSGDQSVSDKPETADPPAPVEKTVQVEIPAVPDPVTVSNGRKHVADSETEPSEWQNVSDPLAGSSGWQDVDPSSMRATTSGTGPSTSEVIQVKKTDEPPTQTLPVEMERPDAPSAPPSKPTLIMRAGRPLAIRLPPVSRPAALKEPSPGPATVAASSPMISALESVPPDDLSIHAIDGVTEVHVVILTGLDPGHDTEETVRKRCKNYGQVVSRSSIKKSVRSDGFYLS